MISYTDVKRLYKLDYTHIDTWTMLCVTFTFKKQLCKKYVRNDVHEYCKNLVKDLPINNKIKRAFMKEDDKLKLFLKNKSEIEYRYKIIVDVAKDLLIKYETNLTLEKLQIKMKEMSKTNISESNIIEELCNFIENYNSSKDLKIKRKKILNEKILNNCSDIQVEFCTKYK